MHFTFPDLVPFTFPDLVPFTFPDLVPFTFPDLVPFTFPDPVTSCLLHFLTSWPRAFYISWPRAFYVSWPYNFYNCQVTYCRLFSWPSLCTWAILLPFDVFWVGYYPCLHICCVCVFSNTRSGCRKLSKWHQIARKKKKSFSFFSLYHKCLSATRTKIGIRNWLVIPPSPPSSLKRWI